MTSDVIYYAVHQKMLASRLLSILMFLQTRGRVSARALAAEFEVSVRTIHRDMDQLSAAGIPVYAERGRSGGFTLLEGYRTTLTGLTPPEAETLFLVGLPGPAAELGLADILSAARLKLLAALPSRLRPDAERIAARFHLDPAPWFREADRQDALQTIARAVWSGRILRLRYRPAGKSEGRGIRLWPLGLVLKAGNWYLVAQSTKHIRSYRVSNISDAEILEEIFPRPKGFDLALHWREACRAYESGVWRGEADIRVHPRDPSLLEMLGTHVAIAARKSAKPDRDGWIRCTIPIESSAHAVRELMRLGDEVEVVGPPKLRKLIAETATDMARRHRTNAS